MCDKSLEIVRPVGRQGKRSVEPPQQADRGLLVPTSLLMEQG